MINAPSILLIDETGKNCGEVASYIAFNQAKVKGMDLILMTRKSKVPVCKFGDYGKLNYEATKRIKENKPKIQKLKTIRIRPCTQTHDLDIEVKKSKEFISKGDKVRIECRFKFRESDYPELGANNIKYIIDNLSGLIKIDQQIEMVGKIMSVVISPI